MQEQEITNQNDFTDVFRAPSEGRLLALDLGTKRIGVAVSDERQFTVRAVRVIKRGSWKKVLKETISILQEFDAVGLVIGLPYTFYGDESEMSREARRLARNYSLSIDVPVFLQDERVSSIAAKDYLYHLGLNPKEIRKRIDGEAAAVILSDFITLRNELKKRRERDQQ